MILGAQAACLQSVRHAPGYPRFPFRNNLQPSPAHTLRTGRLRSQRLDSGVNPSSSITFASSVCYPPPSPSRWLPSCNSVAQLCPFCCGGTSKSSPSLCLKHQQASGRITVIPLKVFRQPTSRRRRIHPPRCRKETVWTARAQRRRQKARNDLAVCAVRLREFWASCVYLKFDFATRGSSTVQLSVAGVRERREAFLRR